MTKHQCDKAGQFLACHSCHCAKPHNLLESCRTMRCHQCEPEPTCKPCPCQPLPMAENNGLAEIIAMCQIAKGKAMPLDPDKVEAMARRTCKYIELRNAGQDVLWHNVKL